MTELVECVRCRKITIDEEYDKHRCIPKITGFKTIPYATSYTVTDEQGRKIITLRGMDGIVYDFIEIPEDKEYTKIPYQPKGNTEKTTDDETEPEIMPKIRKFSSEF